MKYHEDFEKHKGCFTPVVTDPITERVKKNTQDFSDINYRGIQRKVVEMEPKRNDQDQDTITGNRQQSHRQLFQTEGKDTSVKERPFSQSAKLRPQRHRLPSLSLDQNPC